MSFPIERRVLLKGGLAVTGGFVTGLALGHSMGGVTDEQIPTKESTNTERAGLVAELEILDDTTLLDKILQIQLRNPKRLVAEGVYLGKIQNLDLIRDKDKSLEVIDRGLWVISSRETRIHLIDARYQLRVYGHPKLETLPNEKLAWAKSTSDLKFLKLHPEALGLATDGFLFAREILQRLQGQKGSQFFAYFRPDLVYKNRIGEIPSSLLNSITIEDMLMRIGSMATLICTETGITPDGEEFSVPFANIGRVPATLQLAGSYAGTKKELETVFERVSEDTGLKLMVENIPGSVAAAGDSSGGAIGIGFMPPQLLEMQNFLKDSFGIVFNPLDPTQAVAAAYIFVARGQQVGSDYRYGYLRGSYEITRAGERTDIIGAIRLESLLKWNPKESQARIILNAGNDYNQVVLAGGNFEY